MKKFCFYINIFLLVGLFTTTVSYSQTYTYNYSGGMQTFTVPGGVSSVIIETWGAQGGAGSGTSGGYGAYIKGTFSVSPGQVLKILVGGQGGGGLQGGGGGGTFVTDNSNNPMCIAGGGGGAEYPGYDYGTEPGTTGNSGQNGYCGGGCPGSVQGWGGSGGGGGGTNNIYSNSGSGGGGLTGNGVSAVDYYGYPASCGGTSFTNGGWGGCGSGSGGAGGYGGGGGADWTYWTGGGGGGGYSGGGGGTYYGNGGGGGSYNGGSGQTNIAGAQPGNGLAVISVPPPPPCGWSGWSGYNYPAIPCGSFSSLMYVGSGTYTYFTAVAGASYTVSTCGSPFDTDLTIYDANPAWSARAWNQDNGPDCGGTNASLTWTATYSGDHIAIVNRAGCQQHDFTGQSAILKIRQNSGPGCGCSPNQPATTWTGSVSSDWFNGSNWTNCVPGPNTNATVPVVGTSYPVINGQPGYVNTITVNPGATVTNNTTLTATQ